MKKAKQNWVGEQYSETDENLRKNNSKTAYQLVKDLTIVFVQWLSLDYWIRTQHVITATHTHGTGRCIV